MPNDNTYTIQLDGTIKCSTCQDIFTSLQAFEAHSLRQHTKPEVDKDNTLPVVKPKHAGGRPSEYRLEFCPMVISHMSQGLSLETFGAVISHSKDTLYEWIKVYPEFSDAVNEARLKSQLFWERMGVNGTMGAPLQVKNEKGETITINGKFNPLSWKFNMQNRFHWKDRQDVTTNDEKVETTVIYKPERLPEGSE